MTKPTSPYQPYAAVHEKPNGAGDARPTALQIVRDCDAIGKLRGRTVLITGCSSGIGVETARALYAAGATLFLTARDLPKLHAVIDDIVSTATDVADSTSSSTPRPEALELHLDSLASVRSAAAEFTQRSGGALHVLVENAGVMATPLGRTRDGFETQMGTNHFAHFLLFQLLKPLLLASAATSGQVSRVVVLSSAGHRFGGVRLGDPHWVTGAAEYEKWAAYGQSKTANIYMAASVNRHYAARKLVAAAVHPGGILTELIRHMNDEDMEMARQPERQPMFKNPEQGAATTVWAVVSPHFEDARNGGRYLADCGECGPAKGSVPAAAGYQSHIYDEEAEEKLWKLSYEVVGLPVED